MWPSFGAARKTEKSTIKKHSVWICSEISLSHWYLLQIPRALGFIYAAHLSFALWERALCRSRGHDWRVRGWEYVLGCNGNVILGSIHCRLLTLSRKPCKTQECNVMYISKSLLISLKVCHKWPCECLHFSLLYSTYQHVHIIQPTSENHKEMNSALDAVVQETQHICDQSCN